MNDIIDILHDECSDVPRIACEKVLYSAEFESEDKELVQAAREAFQVTAEFYA
jgi:hypothetical protein